MTKIHVCALAHETMKSTITFVTDGAKRWAIFHAAQRDVNSESEQAVKIKKLCDTWFLECHTAVLTFCNQLPAIVHALSLLMEVAKVKTKTKARCLLDSLCRPEVLIGLEIFSAIAKVMKPAAVELQRPD